MPEIGRIQIQVAWRTMERQGPQFSPFMGDLTIFFAGSISNVEIERKVREAFGPFIDSWVVLPLPMKEVSCT